MDLIILGYYIFTAEDPARVAAIIYSVIKYPELLPIYTEAFN